MFRPWLESCRHGGSKNEDDGKAAASRRTPRKSGKELAEDVVDGLGVGLAAGGFHNLADEKFENAFVAGFELGDVILVFCDDFARGLLDRGVADLRGETFGDDDFGGVAAGFEH